MFATNPVSQAVRTSEPEPRGVVFVVDDEASVRESVAILVRWAGWRVKAFAPADEFLSNLKFEAPSCVIVDVQLPGLSGLDLQQRLTSSGHDLPVIFTTDYGDIRRTVQAMKAGAVEVLAKPFLDEELLGAVEQAFERSHATRVRQAERSELRARYESLTPRERQVMSLVVSGLLNKQVGAELGTSEITVKAHRG